MRDRRTLPSIVFMDFLWNTLLIFLIFFVLAYILINPAKQEKNKIETQGIFLITVNWDDDLEDDVDTYVLDPDEHLVYFRRLQDGLMHLERDDRGRFGDLIKDKYGQQILVYKNEERVIIRGIVAGEYVANVHMYHKYEKNNQPVTIKVTLFSLAGQDHEITNNIVSLINDGDETTAFRFSLSPEGQVTNINYLQKEVVRKVGK